MRFDAVSLFQREIFAAPVLQQRNENNASWKVEREIWDSIYE